MYSQIVFALAQLISESPYSILCAVVFFLLWNFPMGFNFSPSRSGFQFFLILVTEFYAVTLGQAVAAISPSVFIASVQNPFLLIIVRFPSSPSRGLLADPLVIAVLALLWSYDPPPRHGILLEDLDVPARSRTFPLSLCGLH